MSGGFLSHSYQRLNTNHPRWFRRWWRWFRRWWRDFLLRFPFFLAPSTSKVALTPMVPTSAICLKICFDNFPWWLKVCVTSQRVYQKVWRKIFTEYLGFTWPKSYIHLLFERFERPKLQRISQWATPKIIEIQCLI